MSRVRLIEALAWKRRANELAKELMDVGSRPNLLPALCSLRSPKCFVLRKA